MNSVGDVMANFAASGSFAADLGGGNSWYSLNPANRRSIGKDSDGAHIGESELDGKLAHGNWGQDNNQGGPQSTEWQHVTNLNFAHFSGAIAAVDTLDTVETDRRI